MKQISYQNYIGKYPIEGEINISVDRELTVEEQVKVSNALEEVLRLINKNTIISSEEFKANHQEERTLLLDCFSLPIYVKEVPSEYGNLLPWYEVTTAKGIITIGWRKRVINIDWTKSDIKYQGSDLFPDEQVTKSKAWDERKYIHADSYEKAKEYIKKLLL